MAQSIGGLSVYIEDDSARFTQSMTRNAALVQQQSQRMSTGLAGVAKSVDDLNRKAGSFQPDAFRALSLSALRSQSSVDRLQKSLLAVTALAGGGFGMALLTKNLTDMADRYTSIQNRLATVVGTGRERVTVEQEIFDISQRTRSSYDDTAKLFQRMSLASKTLGASQSEILSVVETVQKALQAGGATGAEASSIATQLTQAFGSGNVAGDELRSIRENSTILAQAIADEFKVGVGELKKLGSLDQLPADRVFKAIKNAGKAIDDQFKSMTPTFAQAIVVLDNAFTRYIGQVDKSLGVTNALAQGVMALANNLQSLGQAAMTAAPILAILAANRVGQAIGGRARAPFAAEAARRRTALEEAEDARSQAGAAADRAGQSLVDAQKQARRARIEPEAFVETKILRTREALRRQLEVEDAAVIAAEEKYQAALKAAAQQGAPSTASADLLPHRQAFRQAQTALRQAEREAARVAADDTPARIQERLNASLAKEADLRAKANNLAYETRRNLPETIGDPSEARVKGTTRLLAVREQLEKQQQRSVQLAAEFAAAEQVAMAQAVAANDRLVAAKAGLLASEQNLVGAARGRGDSAAVKNVLESQADLDFARQRQQGAREALGTTDAAVRHAGVTNATNALSAAEKAATVTAADYAAAQAVVEQRTIATRKSSVALATVLGGVTSGFGSLVNFLGGRIGAALTVGVVAWSLYQMSVERAAAKNEEFKEAGERVIKVLERLRIAREKQAGVAPAITEANKTVDELEGGVNRAVQSAMTGLPQLSNQFRGLVPSETQQKLLELQGRLTDVQRQGGDVTPVLKDLSTELHSLGNMNPKFGGIVSGFVDIIDKAIEAQGRIFDLKAEVARAQMIGPPIPKGRGEFNEAGDTDKQIKEGAESFRGLLLEGMKARETARKTLDKSLTEADIKKAQEDRNRQRERALRRAQINEEFPLATEEQRERLTESRMSKEKKEKKPKETPEERLSESIKRTREEADASFLSEIDQEVIRAITKKKGTSEIAARVRKQLAAGEPLTGEFADLRSALVAKDAAKEYKEIVEQYGSMAQVAPGVRAEQEKLNFLLASGRIDAAQASAAFADYISKFKEFKWVDKLGDSLKNFGETLADTLYDGKLNAESFAEAINNLGKALFKLALNEAALEPLRQMLRGGLAKAFVPGGSGLAGLFSGGSGGTDTATTLGLYHSGGMVGHPAAYRTLPSSVLDGAPHYAGGLRPNEFAAILHQGEAVLTARQQMGMASLAGGMSNMKGGYNVVVNEAPGTQAQVSQGENGGLQIDILSMAEAGLADRMSRGRGTLAKASRAGGRANLRG